MSDLSDRVYELVKSSGGKMTYPQIYEVLGYEDRQRLPNAIRENKRSGKLQQRVDFDPVTGQNTHNVSVVK